MDEAEKRAKAYLPGWNRVDQSLPNNRGFDQDAVLPFRERLIIVYEHTDKAGLTDNITISQGIGEAYVHDGEWYWWNLTSTNAKVKIKPDKYKIFAWTIFPHNLFGK